MQYLDGKTTVTHIIAGGLTPKKKVEFRRYRIVKPAWVVDSIAAGKLLPWDEYRVVDEGAGQKILGFGDGGKVVSSSSQVDGRAGYREQTEKSWYTNQLRKQEDIAKRVEIHDIQESADPAEQESPPSAQPVPSSSAEFGGGSFVEEILKAEEELLTGKSIPAELPPHPVEDTRNDQVSQTRSTLQPESRHSPRANISPKKPMTAEEHNAILLANPHMRKSSTANPEFLKQYYEESRLHHLSTWKAELKASLQRLTHEKSASQKARHKRAPGSRRYILHVDFDSFFAAVSLLKHPDLVDKPVVVAHGNGSGAEIASCNYPARKYGVKNGMWMKTAQELCSELKVLPYDFKAYEDASRHFYKAIMDTDGVVQSVSVDEALVDVSVQCVEAGGTDGRGVHEGSLYREQMKADEIAQGLRDAILASTGCHASVGIGGNILLAKSALRKAKPAGQFQVKPEEVLDFIGELTVQSLPGVAYSIGGKLEEIGVTYVKDIRALTKDRLVTTLGPKTGEKLWDYSRGIDKTEVGEQVVRKSVSAEVNWGIRFINQQQAEDFVQSLCNELSKRLIENSVKGRQLTMKIMRRAADAPIDPPKHLGHGKCDTFNRTIVLGVATQSGEIIGKEAIAVLRGFGFSPGELRGLGAQMTRLEPLKGSAAGAIDSSQKRLSFKTPASSKTLSRSPTADTQRSASGGKFVFKSPISEKRSKTIDGDPIEEAQIVTIQTSTTKDRLNDEDDPIEDVPDAAHPSTIKRRSVYGLDLNNPDHRPLNLMGTQFILPSQVDPEVLAELPEDIRSKFAPKHATSPPISREITPASDSRAASPALDIELPSGSQLDPDALAALPEDVRAEVLAFYTRSPRKSGGQQLLPQSPRKAQTSYMMSKKQLTPTKKRGRPKIMKSSGGGSTLTQANFLSNKLAAAAIETDSDTSDAEPAEMSADFLAALPADIRQELLEEQRRERLKRTGGLGLATNKRKPPPAPAAPAPEGGPLQKQLRLPSRPEIPTFTSKKLHKLEDLREAMDAWYEEFSDDGPYAEDVQALVQYLSEVVLTEKNLAKAVAVVTWVIRLVELDDRIQNEEAIAAWLAALDALRDCVQDALRQRGLGEVEF